MRFHFQSAGINRQYFALIFQIVVDNPLPVGNGKFRPSAQINLAYILSRSWIDRCRVVAVAIKGEDVLRCGIVNNAVGVWRGICLTTPSAS